MYHFTMRNIALILFFIALCFTRSFALVTWNDFMKKAQYKTSHISENVKPFISKYYPFDIVSEQCTNSLVRYADGLKNWNYWAVNMFDVTGKPPSSFLRGTNTDFGSFDDCLEIEVSKNVESDYFKGQFCMLHIQSSHIVPLNNISDDGKSYFDKYGHPPDWISETMKYEGLLRKFGLYLGICLPSTCSEEDIINAVTAFVKSYDLKVSLSDCQIKESKIWSLSSKLSLLVILCLVALCSTGTYIASYYQQSYNNSYREDDKSLGRKVLEAFSFSKNWKELNELNEDKNLHSLPGIKFLLCGFIVFGHTIAFETYWSEKSFRNFFKLKEMLAPIAIMGDNAFYSVEYFFCLSGFYLTCTLWKEFEKNSGVINLKELMLKKIYRLAPVHAFLIVLLFIFPVISNGPIWNSTWNEELRKCYNYGWSNLVFLQNFQSYENICWLHTWYIAASLQIQITSILLLILVYRYPKTGIICGILINIGCYWRNFHTSSSKGYLLPTLKDVNDFVAVRQYLTNIYFKPYSHVASHTIGMVLGWLVIKGYRVPKIYHVPIWILYFPSSILLLLSVYYPTQNITVLAFLNTFRNTVHSLLFTWLLYTSSTGSSETSQKLKEKEDVEEKKKKGYIKRSFCSSVFTPLDRISYCLYLLHPLFIVYLNANMRERVYMSKTDHIVKGCTVLIASAFLATIGYLMVEQPFNKIFDIWVSNKSTIYLQNSEKKLK